MEDNEDEEMERIKQEDKVGMEWGDKLSKEKEIIEQDDSKKEEWPLPSHTHPPLLPSFPSSTNFDSFVSFDSINELHDFSIFNHL